MPKVDHCPNLNRGQQVQYSTLHMAGKKGGAVSEEFLAKSAEKAK